MEDNHGPRSSPENLLNFWISVECLLPQKAPNCEPDNRIWDIPRDEELPWNDVEKLARLVNHFGLPEGGQNGVKPWAFTIYAGLVDMTLISQELRTRFRESETEETKERDPSGESAVLCLKADGNGRIQSDFVVSRLPWAMGKIRGSGGVDFDLVDFDEKGGYTERFGITLNEILSHHVEPDSASAGSETDSGAGPSTGEESEGFIERRAPATIDLLRRCLSAVFGEASWGIDNRAVKETIRIAAVRAGKTASGEEPDMLNSFFVTELLEVKESIDQIPRTLSQYLGVERPERIDIVANPQYVDDRVFPLSFPKARWPSKDPMALAQQFAVNKAMELLGGEQSRGLYSINGPPGTGKTTLLRDLVAAILCKRADAMAELNNPRAAFESGPAVINKAGKEAHVHLLRRDGDIAGHGMVVASGNNGAVQNVSRELPSLKSMTALNVEVPNYFRKVAETLTNSPGAQPLKAGSVGVGSAWGLVSAVLGNSKNRKEFADRFWWSDQEKPPISSEACKNEQPTSFLTELSEKCASKIGWNRARQNYKDAVRKVSERQRLMDQYARAWCQERITRARIAQLEKEGDGLLSRQSPLKMEYEDAAKLLSRRASELANFRLLKTAWQKVIIAQRRWTDCEASLGGLLKSLSIQARSKFA
jgi:hypothetical protein